MRVIEGKAYGAAAAMRWSAYCDDCDATYPASDYLALSEQWAERHHKKTGHAAYVLDREDV